MRPGRQSQLSPLLLLMALAPPLKAQDWDAILPGDGEHTAQVSVGLAVPVSDSSSIAIEYVYTENDDAELKIGWGLTL